MRSLVQYISWSFGLTLEVLVLNSLVRGPYRKFPFVFAYCLTLLLTTIVEVAAFTSPELKHSANLYYWINDAILQFLMFCVVISLIYDAMAAASRRATVRRWLILGAVLISISSFLIHRNTSPLVSAWMTSVSRDLSFCSVILDLLLWSILLASRTKNHRLLMLSGGLGIQFTGEAIGQSLRQLSRRTASRSIMWGGNVIVLAADLLCLYVWWQAFRRGDRELTDKRGG